MPRNVRNFWIECDIDGRASRIVGGPVRKDGGFSLRVFIRDSGSVQRALTLNGRALSDGRLQIDIEGALDAFDLEPCALESWAKRIVASR